MNILLITGGLITAGAAIAVTHLPNEIKPDIVSFTIKGLLSIAFYILLRVLTLKSKIFQPKIVGGAVAAAGTELSK